MVLVLDLAIKKKQNVKCKVLCRQHQINVVEIIFIQCKCVGYDA